MPRRLKWCIQKGRKRKEGEVGEMGWNSRSGEGMEMPGDETSEEFGSVREKKFKEFLI